MDHFLSFPAHKYILPIFRVLLFYIKKDIFNNCDTAALKDPLFTSFLPTVPSDLGHPRNNVPTALELDSKRTVGTFPGRKGVLLCVGVLLLPEVCLLAYVALVGFSSLFLFLFVSLLRINNILFCLFFLRFLSFSLSHTVCAVLHRRRFEGREGV